MENVRRRRGVLFGLMDHGVSARNTKRESVGVTKATTKNGPRVSQNFFALTDTLGMLKQERAPAWHLIFPQDTRTDGTSTSLSFGFRGSLQAFRDEHDTLQQFHGQGSSSVEVNGFLIICRIGVGQNRK